MEASDPPNIGKIPGVEHKFKHVTNVACVEKHMGSIHAEYYLYWHIDALIRF
jgi:hypothetical protein